MQLKTYRVDGATFVASPYRPGISLREDVFRRQFHVECEGQFEYAEDQPIWGTYQLRDGITLGERGLIEKAMALAERCVTRDDFELRDDGDLISFCPELVTILDDHDRRVLAGEVTCREIHWREPVSSAAEANEVSRQIAKLYAEASYERGQCDNFCTARRLGLDARILEGRLVHPIWRDHARAALKAAAV